MKEELINNNEFIKDVLEEIGINDEEDDEEDDEKKKLNRKDK